MPDEVCLLVGYRGGPRFVSFGVGPVRTSQSVEDLDPFLLLLFKLLPLPLGLALDGLDLLRARLAASIQSFKE